MIHQWPDEILPQPSQTYRIETDPNVNRSRMETGRTRQRRRFTRTTQVVSVVWEFTAEQYSIFDAFYTHVLEAGTEQFKINLRFGPEMTLVTASFVGRLSTSYKTHDNFEVRATLELEAANYLDRESARALFGL